MSTFVSSSSTSERIAQMSATNSSPTAASAPAPVFHVENLAAAPGSTAAGIGVLAAVLAQAASAPPSTPFGWVLLVLQACGGIAAMFGK
jgi:hypothetical protein